MAIPRTTMYLDEETLKRIKYAQDFYRQRDGIEISRSAVVRIAISDYAASLKERKEQEQTRNDR
jgi:hypothetical protein